ncbi:pyrimidine dimer DNA glycosylase/endonuclease V [Candidatus Woesearchaeota archaeon]|nr:pyrimidine dimer DNA glycosylase/endonuclease V [Candidatus Woesearchaeota archaeon]
MVRINLISPSKLTDQHLVAEYDEMLMLMAYVRAHQGLEGIPKDYCLGKGHIKFFKNKIGYLRKRHELLKREMRKRGFAARKTIYNKGIDKKLINDWSPNPQDLQIIKKRIRQKICLKPDWYRYYGKHRSKEFLLKLLS